MACRAKVHVSGAEPGDLVLVSGEAVIGGIAARRLSFGDAVGRGLVRLYGAEPQIAEFVLRFGESVRPMAMPIFSSSRTLRWSLHQPGEPTSQRNSCFR